MFNLPGTKKKTIVGLAVTPNLGIEATVYDKDTKEVVKYARKYLEYNIASRSIQDIDTFRNIVIDIFDELGLAIESTNIFLVIPNVHFGFRSFEDEKLTKDEIETVVASESMESYIFKQEEPVCAFVDVNANTGAASKYIAYSAIQRKMFDNLQDAIMDLGGNLVGIESAPTAIPRGISMTGVCSDVIKDDRNWSILVINPNNYAIFQMTGSRILDYAEVPFAIMSFDGDDVYPAIASSAVQYLSSYPANKLVIVSQTDNVSARALKTALVYDKPIETFNSNSYSKEPCVAVGEDVLRQVAAPISLCALAAAAPKYEEFSALNTMNVVGYDGISVYGTVNFGGKEVEVSSILVAKLCLILIFILVAIGAAILIPLFGMCQFYSSRSTELQGQIDTLNGEITAIEGKIKASVGALIKQIGDNNKQSINYYDSLSNDMPPQVWLTYYVNKDGKEVGIEGLSIDINQIYQYFKNLKTLSPKSDIKLNKLEVFNGTQKDTNVSGTADEIVLDTNDDKQQVFSFEISNTTYQKGFDESGNKAKSDSGTNGGEASSSSANPPANPPANSSSVPSVPDVDANLKEAN